MGDRVDGDISGGEECGSWGESGGQLLLGDCQLPEVANGQQSLRTDT